jgi:hypothetical protein
MAPQEKTPQLTPPNLEQDPLAWVHDNDGWGVQAPPEPTELAHDPWDDLSFDEPVVSEPSLTSPIDDEDWWADLGTGTVDQAPVSTPTPVQERRRFRDTKLAKGLAAIALTATLAAGGLGIIRSGTAESASSQDTTEQVAEDTVEVSDAELADLEARALVPAPTYDDVSTHLEAKRHDANEDPSYRAATVTVAGSDASIDNYLGEGTGSIVDIDGDLYFASIRHVTEGLDTTVPEDQLPTIFIPGVGYMRPDFTTVFERDVNPSVEISQYVGEGDANTFVQFNEDQQALLRAQQARGVIEPLPLTDSVPQEGQLFVVPRPEDGSFIEFSFAGPTSHMVSEDGRSMDGFGQFLPTAFEDSTPTEQEALDLNAYLCGGASGSPLMTTDGEYVGSLAAIHVKFDENGRACGIDAIAPVA